MSAPIALVATAVEPGSVLTRAFLENARHAGIDDVLHKPPAPPDP